MDLAPISLISFGNINQELTEIAADIARVFSVPVRTRNGNLDLSEFYDPARRQYNGNLLLKQMDQDFSVDQTKTLCLFNVDLFIPILTYIFGQAYLGGNIGIASMYRLGNERYGIQADSAVLRDRFLKEIVHELGHLYSLIHCTDPVCVMRSSTYVEDIDQKNHTLCPVCRTKLNLMNLHQFS
jgi:archaemetzincin